LVRDVENIYSGKAKTAFQYWESRLPLEKQASAATFELEDIDCGLSRHVATWLEIILSTSSSACWLGAEFIIKKFRGV
jgi:hypothetical protein